ncbi:MAG: alanine--glyoxylate aminotransferase family protein [Vampirovibrionales bacterium]|nr:alanine--glyoxylate aminotransferase family protein [Vampirovibrionales bacterium]
MTADLLMIPGPTPLPDAVRDAMARPAIGHRGPEFKAILERVFPALKQVFKTESDVLLYTASATGAIEAAMQNTLNAGDHIAVLGCGVFSNRWADLAETLGLRVTRVQVPAGQANTVESLEQTLAADTAKSIKAVVMVHSETSTGVQNPVKELVALIKAHGALSIVDGVTSIGAAPFEMDAWGVDLAIAGSQKAFMIPPGLAFLAVGPKAWAAHEQVKNPGFYFNFKRYKKSQDAMTTPYTPATHLVMALDVALTMMLQTEGLEAVHARHLALRDLTRQGVRELGFELFVPNDADASLAVTSVKTPAGTTIDALRKTLKTRFGITVADGQADLKGQIFRIGHLGYINERDVRTVLSALRAL